MNGIGRRYVRILVGMCAALLGASALCLPASADEQIPSYAKANRASGEETIRGRIVSIPGKFRLELRDKRGFTDAVELHQGTIINPTGLTLAPGMSVTILGYSRGSVFAANEIDTPYSASYSYTYVPNYVPYYGYDYGYAYPGAYAPWGWGANVIYAPGIGGYGWYGGGGPHDGDHGSWNGNGGNNGNSWHGGELRRTL